ncbi:hypothetical protein JL100_030710 (plasmid) [Skermanella mucosa]|uniref:hypothetical protein n=1 Tax=Skermanella mucosa TaxID=1789672 RepID=UPI00192AD0CD|nr:hypothetical protein [Skermanella mucosa]UEM24587.1 hypothetical protein JL100_030710 [Skermanella mucosa]
MELTGEAFAIGEQTIAEGDIDLEITDLGTTTVASGTSSFSATSQSGSDNTAYASAETSAAISPGGKTVAWSLETSNTAQSEGESEWSVSSTTGSLVVYDSSPGTGTDSSSLGTSTGGGTADTQASAGTPDSPESGNAAIDPLSAWEFDMGNIAVLDIDASAYGQDTYISVDGSILTVENQLSTVSALVIGGVG